MTNAVISTSVAVPTKANFKKSSRTRFVLFGVSLGAWEIGNMSLQRSAAFWLPSYQGFPSLYSGIEGGSSRAALCIRLRVLTSDPKGLACLKWEQAIGSIPKRWADWLRGTKNQTFILPCTSGGNAFDADCPEQSTLGSE